MSPPRSLCTAREGQRWKKPFWSPQVLPPLRRAEVMGKMLCSQALPVATIPYGERNALRG